MGEKYEPFCIDRKDRSYSELITNNDLELASFGAMVDDKQSWFPFSKAVPVVCNQIKKFLFLAHDFVQFSKKPDELLSNTLEALMLHMRNCIVLSMEESYSHANIAQLVQIHQNLNYFVGFT